MSIFLESILLHLLDSPKADKKPILQEALETLISAKTALMNSLVKLYLGNNQARFHGGGGLGKRSNLSNKKLQICKIYSQVDAKFGIEIFMYSWCNDII